MYGYDKLLSKLSLPASLSPFSAQTLKMILQGLLGTRKKHTVQILGDI